MTAPHPLEGQVADLIDPAWRCVKSGCEDAVFAGGAHCRKHALRDAEPVERHDCEHTSMQHGADGCNVPGCLCAFMSWDEDAIL